MILSRIVVALASVFISNAVVAANEQPESSGSCGVDAFAPSGVLVQSGRASETTTLSLGLQWNWSRGWHLGEHGRLAGHHEVSLGWWRVDDGAGATVTQIGVTPALRYWPDGAMHGWFYEGGIGVNWLTPLYRTPEKRFSTTFNFGDHLAVGYRSAPRGWEWSLRMQHFSNAGINRPNPGENFVQLRLVVPLGYGE
ncbi:MAG: lipid A deacylase PagL [Betaproteobacteria bacterium]|nr:MAG: lipid A deacylase PagL [Betaproteobacteria bacterium]